MSTASSLQSPLLGKMNEQQVLRTVLHHGPLSRGELAQRLGITRPTVSKAVDSLLSLNLLEEREATSSVGRPAKRLALAAERVQVLGLVIDAGMCRVCSAGLDGRISPERSSEFPTPDTYQALLDLSVEHARRLIRPAGVTTLGMGISIPGLVDYRQKQSLLSPNVPQTVGHFPARDLEQRLGVECVLAQEEHGLCLAERSFGNARGLDNFAVLDVSTGVGLGVISGGRLLTGQTGLAGEIGHVTVELHGAPCGCGNRGCLETVACDSALARLASEQHGRRLTFEHVAELAARREIDLTAPLETVGAYLAVAFAAVINLFNPAVLIVHGGLFSLDEGLFPRVAGEAKQRALRPSAAQCEIVQARGSKRLGALATIIEHRIDSLVSTDVMGFRPASVRS